MPMKKDVDIQKSIYDAYIWVNGSRVYKITTKKIYVESYVDQPSIRVDEFWRDYAYSGLADEWFPHLDPDSIHYEASPGQYGIGTDVRAYGLLRDAPKDLIGSIREELRARASAKTVNAEIDKKIKELKKSKTKIRSQMYFDY